MGSYLNYFPWPQSRTLDSEQARRIARNLRFHLDDNGVYQELILYVEQSGAVRLSVQNPMYMQERENKAIQLCLGPLSD